ncbi:Ca2+-binding RTX toxin-like protein [Microvirga flocculans]|uniref:Ca2+-binding RTX toxin-like protein n=1 Tax=Microvirga flocculans TaxID=217168 RepID=A0A7W6IC06_9HYPH|nr:calcium-binding protein [Microvirga flocculans]MBB4038644.1 Ca2+-binding RTX toxin-like protein [Microvirga flocculans]
MAIEKWGNARTVSVGVKSSYEGTVTSLPNGGYVVVWDADTITCVQVYDGLGNPVGPRRDIPSTVGNPRKAQVTALDDGSFIVAWSGASSAIQAQKFSITGVPDASGPVLIAGTENSHTNDFPSVASWGTDKWVAVWADSDNSTGNPPDNIQFLRQGGTKFSIATAAGVTDPDVVELADGRHVVTWEESGRIKVAIVNANNTVQPLADALGGSSANGREPTISALSTGGFVVSWRDSGDRKFSTQVYNSNGTQVAAGSMLKQGEYVQYPPEVVGLTKGGFEGGYAVVSVDWIGKDNGDIYLRLVKADGTVVGPKLINDGTLQAGSQWLSSVTELPDGRISIAWDSGGTIYNQIIDAREKAVTVEGSTWDDTYVGTNIADQTDILKGRAGNDALYGGTGDDVLNGGIGADRLDGGANFDWASYVNATTGVQASLVDPKQNTGEAQGDSYISIEGIEGSDFDDRLTGLNSGSALSGRWGNDTLNGGAGVDTLNGGIGNDWLYGGAGADNLHGGDGDPSSASYVNAQAFVGDTASYQGASSGVRANLGNASENKGDAAGDSYVSIENLVGSEFADVLTGDANANWIATVDGDDLVYGLAGNDLFWGQGGNDTLVGGAGADTLDGGAGFNYASYADSAAGVVVNGLNPSLNTGDAVGDVFVSIQGLIGSKFNDTLSGFDNSIALWGGDGADKLTGGEGSDTLDGGSGADSLNGGGGIDFVSYQSSGTGVTIVLPKNGDGTVGEDIFTNIEGLIGSNFNDVLTGNTSSNELRGMDGNDILVGVGSSSGTSDTLNGGSGIDTVDYSAATTAVTVNLATGKGSGSNTAGDVYVGIENVIGSQFGDTFVGNGATNAFYGGKGDDIYYVSAGDVVVEGASEGNDTVVTDANYALGANLESLTGTGGGALILTGNALSNTITGNAAGNWIDGGEGADTMIGGAGDDFYVIDNAGDVIIDTEGNNKVLLKTAYDLSKLPSSVIVSIADGINIPITGTNGANVLRGNAAANIMKGQGGNDTLYGLAGNDRLYGGSGKDVFVFDTRLNKSTNVDKIYDFKSRDDSFWLDNAIFTKLGKGTPTKPAKIKSGMFYEGTKAHDKDDRIIYDKKTGNLYYDADGTGRSAQVKFATLSNKEKLYYHDFLVI